jgi:hypothetical protein
MLKFLKCMVIKTKYDEHEQNKDQSIQCNLSTATYTSCDKSVQCDILTLPSQDIKPPIKTTSRLVFLREKAICNIPFELHEEDAGKYIVIKGEKVFLQHIKGHFKYDHPWILR